MTLCTGLRCAPNSSGFANPTIPTRMNTTPTMDAIVFAIRLSFFQFVSAPLRRGRNVRCSLLVFNLLDLDALALDVEPQPAVDAHILIGDPHQREAADQITAPVGIQQLVARDNEEEDGYIMAKTILAGEQVKKLAFKQSSAALAFSDAKIARLAEDFFVRHRPGDAGDGHGEDEQPGDLQT